MRVLRPLACLLPNAAKTAALVILNRPLEGEILKQFFNISLFKAVTDGGINRLFTCFDGQQDKYIPDLITGDFDSATRPVLDFYQQQSVSIMNTPDQDETDFTKCLRITVDKTKHLPVDQYLIVGSMGGRLDHHYANVATLFKAITITPRPVYLISSGNLACLLPPGKTVIQADTGLEDDWCGLIPMGCRCDHVTTTGLKWNLSDQPLAFGELVSTSNTYSAQQVTVETDQPLLWTMGYRFSEQASEETG
ncbi:hypothetical protein V1264_008085 [Littorina saxatilis]|uniref:Thiamine pyrophosphokinase 1 n=2 Tax=Littorina saxatilis TaxID=31220 RepID=A0AAN9AST9_9CAEN